MYLYEVHEEVQVLAVLEGCTHANKEVAVTLAHNALLRLDVGDELALHHQSLGDLLQGAEFVVPLHYGYCSERTLSERCYLQHTRFLKRPFGHILVCHSLLQTNATWADHCVIWMKK